MGKKEESDLSECIIRWALKVKWQRGPVTLSLSKGRAQRPTRYASTSSA
jgi:hypothetical protein